MGRVRQSLSELSASIVCIADFIDDHLPSGWMLDLSFSDGDFHVDLYEPVNGNLLLLGSDEEDPSPWSRVIQAVNHARQVEGLSDVDPLDFSVD